MQQEQSETTYLRQGEYGLDPEYGLRIWSPDMDYFQNLTEATLSQDIHWSLAVMLIAIALIRI